MLGNWIPVFGHQRLVYLFWILLQMSLEKCNQKKIIHVCSISKLSPINGWSTQEALSFFHGVWRLDQDLLVAPTRLGLGETRASTSTARCSNVGSLYAGVPGTGGATSLLLAEMSPWPLTLFGIATAHPARRSIGGECPSVGATALGVMADSESWHLAEWALAQWCGMMEMMWDHHLLKIVVTWVRRKLALARLSHLWLIFIWVGPYFGWGEENCETVQFISILWSEHWSHMEHETCDEWIVHVTCEHAVSLDYGLESEKCTDIREWVFHCNLDQIYTATSAPFPKSATA